MAHLTVTKCSIIYLTLPMNNPSRGSSTSRRWAGPRWEVRRPRTVPYIGMWVPCALRQTAAFTAAIGRPATRDGLCVVRQPPALRRILSLSLSWKTLYARPQATSLRISAAMSPQAVYSHSGMDFPGRAPFFRSANRIGHLREAHHPADPDSTQESEESPLKSPVVVYGTRRQLRSPHRRRCNPRQVRKVQVRPQRRPPSSPTRGSAEGVDSAVSTLPPSAEDLPGVARSHHDHRVSAGCCTWPGRAMRLSLNDAVIRCQSTSAWRFLRTLALSLGNTRSRKAAAHVRSATTTAQCAYPRAASSATLSTTDARCSR